MDTIGKRIIENGNMASTLVSSVVDLSNMLHLGVHCTWTGVPTGTLYFEISGEIGAPANWETIANLAVTGAGQQLWLDRNTPYKWARLRYVPSAGTGTLNIHAITRGHK
jgi:hypothetical protein